MDSQKILVTGATGYVGGRLVPRLIEAGYSVRVLTRDASRLAGRDWSASVETVEGDVLDPATLAPALTGIDTAYYLIHSMGSGDSFVERDQRAAENFGRAAADAGVRRIIYLGGLGQSDADLSHHLRSRQHVGDTLRESGVPVTEFRAAVIVGSGSISFEMVRYLTERVPFMICPRWVFTRIQPIAIRDVLAYLLAALETPASAGEVIEIGGADVTTYGGMMLGYAQARDLQRWLIPVPVLTPRLSSYWVHLVTPIPSNIARPLIDGLHNEVVVHDLRARSLFPDIHPLDYQTAVKLALQRLTASEVETTWSDALSSSMGDVRPYMYEEREGMMIEQRQRVVNTDPHTVYRAFTGLGGKRGWLFLNSIWYVRGMMDRLVGGPGYRRGRRDPVDLRVGEALDFWRVEALEPDRLLRLRAEMKLPGQGWLEFIADPLPNGKTRLTQTAYFAPRGLFGFVYWYALLVSGLHPLIFTGMVNRLVQQIESGTAPEPNRRTLPLFAALLGLAAGLVVLVKMLRRD